MASKLEAVDDATKHAPCSLIPDIAAARQWITRLQTELAEHGLDEDPRDALRCRIAERIQEEIARVERLIAHATTESDALGVTP